MATIHNSSTMMVMMFVVEACCDFHCMLMLKVIVVDMRWFSFYNGFDCGFNWWLI